jgi:hypothetical protein
VDELTKEFLAASQEGLERMEFRVTGLEERSGDAPQPGRTGEQG